MIIPNKELNALMKYIKDMPKLFGFEHYLNLNISINDNDIYYEKDMFTKKCIFNNKNLYFNYMIRRTRLIKIAWKKYCEHHNINNISIYYSEYEKIMFYWYRLIFDQDTNSKDLNGFRSFK